jgi:hypothetical protein
VLNAGATAGALFVTGGTLLAGSVTVSGASILNAGATAGALFVTGGSFLEGFLTVSGASVLNAGATAGALFVTGGTLLAGSVTVSGASIFNAGLTGGSLNITGASWLQGGATAGALMVTGGTLIGGALTVTGASYFVGNVSMGSNVTISGPAFKIPTGDIAARPSPAEAGYVRYNSETQQFEGYGPGNAWGSLGGVIDIAQTTKVLASETPSTTDGNLYFITVNSERMRINSAGNIGIGTSAPSYKLDIDGMLRASSGIISNTVDITPSLGDIVKEKSFSAQNNQISEANITGFAFSNSIVRAFHAMVSVSIIKSSGANLYANYDLKAIQKDTGDWYLNVSFVGDDTGIIFGITNVSNNGQIQYISSNIANWASTTIKFKANTTSA